MDILEEIIINGKIERTWLYNENVQLYFQLQMNINDCMESILYEINKRNVQINN
jgi:hypothetical protein